MYVSTAACGTLVAGWALPHSDRVENGTLVNSLALPLFLRFCVRPVYAMRQKLFVGERLLRRLLSCDHFFEREKETKKAKCYGCLFPLFQIAPFV